MPTRPGKVIFSQYGIRSYTPNRVVGTVVLLDGMAGNGLRPCLSSKYGQAHPVVKEKPGNYRLESANFAYAKDYLAGGLPR
jgi:hypothetical protein